MACRFTYNGKEYDQDGLAEALRKMPPVEAAKFIPGLQAPPEMPFKTIWPDLALKRMLHRASTERNPDGSYKYDALSWTPGEAQAARYDLSHHVDHIDHFKNADGTYNVAAMKGHEQIWHDDRATPEAIEKNIGKEMADKITQGEGKDIGSNWNPGTRRLSGVDLKVGGAGMKSFYDKMLPDKANALVKKFGARVERSNTNTARTGNHYAVFEGDERVAEFATEAQAREYANEFGLKFKYQGTAEQPIHLLRITPALRAVAEKGFPTFASGGRINPTEAQA